jgi:outer membrane scaffolding protein for murein synthesis (MipA/OmpV family)
LVRHWVFGLYLCASLGALPALAQDKCEPDCVAVGDWRLSVGLGLGVRSNPLHQGDDIPLVVLPEISYYGERFFLKNLEMGFTLYEDRRHQLNALLTPGYDQMYFNRWDPFNFTDSGGFFSAGTSTGAGANYSVNISAQPRRSDLNAGSFPSWETVGALHIPQAQGVIINDRMISVEAGNQTLAGREGNIITVIVDGNTISIDGVTAGDRIVLDGVAAVEARSGANLEWQQSDIKSSELLDTPTRVSVGVSENRYLLTAEAAADDNALAARKIPADSVAHRRMAGLAGLEYAYTLDWVSLHAQALSDFTGVHDGYELRMALVVPWQWGEQRWAATLGANYKSRQVLDYYYGIDARDVDDDTLFYSPASAGVERLLRLDWQKPLSRHWSLRAMLQYVELPREVHASPLVSDKHVGTVFFGGVYHF